MRRIDNIIKKIRLSLEDIFPGNLHLYYDEEISKWRFVVLDEDLYFKYRFSKVYPINVEFAEYFMDFIIGWDILGEYQEYKTPIPSTILTEQSQWENLYNSPFDLELDLDMMKYSPQEHSLQWTKHSEIEFPALEIAA
jgi:hypothetical protein